MSKKLTKEEIIKRLDDIIEAYPKAIDDVAKIKDTISEDILPDDLDESIKALDNISRNLNVAYHQAQSIKDIISNIRRVPRKVYKRTVSFMSYSYSIINKTNFLMFMKSVLFKKEGEPDESAV